MLKLLDKAVTQRNRLVAPKKIRQRMLKHAEIAVFQLGNRGSSQKDSSENAETQLAGSLI